MATIVAVDICFHLITYSSTRSSTNVLSEERANFARGRGGKAKSHAENETAALQ